MEGDNQVPDFTPEQEAILHQVSAEMLQEMMQKLKRELVFSNAALRSPPQSRATFAPPQAANLRGPEPFAGDPKALTEFKLSVTEIFEAYPDIYYTEAQKIQYIGSLLTGPPRKWFALWRQSKDFECATWNALFDALDDLYGEEDQYWTTGLSMAALRQQNGSGVEYARKFRELALDIRSVDDILPHLFVAGLDAATRRFLDTIHPWPKNLKGLTELCAIYERRKLARPPPPQAPPAPITATPAPARAENLQPPPSSTGAKKVFSFASRTGQPENPKAPAPAPASADAKLMRIELTQSTNQTPPPSPEIPQTVEVADPISVDIEIGKDETSGPVFIKVPAFIDSGASCNFVSQQLVDQLRLTLIPVSPITTNLATGPSRATISHQTPSLTLRIGAHEERLAFFVLPGNPPPLVLGSPWIRRNAQAIDWKKGQVSFAQVTRPALAGPPEHAVSTPVPSPSADPPSSLPVTLSGFADVFSKTLADTLPEHRIYDCEIRLSSEHKPKPRPIYNLNRQESLLLAEYIKSNLEKGFIRPSVSPIAAPIFFTSKKDGTLRPCVDYRQLNAITVKNRAPLPLIEEILESLAGATIFTKLDLHGAYNLVRIKPGDEWKTAFRCREGLFEYRVMPFGLANAPALFQSMMSDIFRDMLGTHLFIYLDDLLIFSKDTASHESHVQAVLCRLREHKLYAKLSKCVFAVPQVEFLGYIVSADGIAMTPDKTSAIREWKCPASVKELQSFLGFANFYRRFLSHYSDTVSPLTNLTRKNVPFIWDEACETAFTAVKTAVTTAPILRHADPNLEFTVETDASDFALGAVLSQPASSSDPTLHPVAFISRKLSREQLNYDVHDKELLAIIFALESWRHHLQGLDTPFIILCDHRNLLFFREKRILSQRHARWANTLSTFNFSLQYRPGDTNVVADTLSRRSDLAPDRVDDGAPAHKRSITLLPDAVWAASVTTPQSAPAKRLISSEEEKLKILRERHDSFRAGHPGRRRTHELVARDFTWPHMRAEINAYVDACLACHTNKPPRSKPHGLLSPLPVPSRPWGSISVDLIVKLPKSQGYDAILVVVCRLTKLAHFIPIRENYNVKKLARTFVNNVFVVHGLPDEIVSDRGPQFTSKFWTQLLRALKIEQSLSTAFHPETDGQTERVNQVLEQILRCSISYLQDDWVSILKLAEFAYNNASSSSTGHSPFMATYGFHPRCDFLEPTRASDFVSEHHMDHIKSIQEAVKESLANAQQRMKKYADRRRRPHSFQAGDQVFLSRKNIKSQRPCPKLDAKFIGPFQILAMVSENAAELRLPPKCRIHPVFHVSLLKPYKPDARFAPTDLAPPSVLVDGVEEHEVADIIDSRCHYRKVSYRVRWAGLPDAESTWEPIENLNNCLDLVRDFHRRYPDKPIHQSLTAS